MKRKVIAIFIAVIIGFSSFAGTSDTETKKLSRTERKELREKEAEANAAVMKEILESRNWVLEADRLRDRYGNSGFVDAGINFVSLSGDNAVIQLGVTDEMGLNGVGGITLEGKVSKYEVKQGRKASSGITMILSVSGSAVGHATINFSVNPNGNASATVSTVDGGRLTWEGKIVSSAGSRTFKGTTTH